MKYVHTDGTPSELKDTRRRVTVDPIREPCDPSDTTVAIAMGDADSRGPGAHEPYSHHSGGGEAMPKAGVDTTDDDFSDPPTADVEVTWTITAELVTGSQLQHLKSTS